MGTGLKNGMLSTDYLLEGNLSSRVDKKGESFLARAMSELLYGFIHWTLTKRLLKKLFENYTYMLCVVINKSWK